MTQQFHEGEEVEVRQLSNYSDTWRKAKIVRQSAPALPRVNEPAQYDVQFPDGSRAVFDAEHIRAIGQRRGPFENEGLNKELRKYEDAKREIESKSFAGRKGENPSWE